jgi:hypothetical protein
MSPGQQSGSPLQAWFSPPQHSPSLHLSPEQQSRSSRQSSVASWHSHCPPKQVIQPQHSLLPPQSEPASLQHRSPKLTPSRQDMS